MAIMDISVMPVGTGTPSLSEQIARAVRLAKESGLEYSVTAMGTEITGDVDVLLDLAAAMHKAVLQGKVRRVITTIKLDDRTDKEVTLKSRVAAVEEKLAVLEKE